MANTDHRAMMEQIARLKLRLLEKKLEQERDERDERLSTATSTGSDGAQEALYGALRRRKDLLHRLREQLGETSRPRTRGDSRRRQQRPAPPAAPRFVPVAPRFLPPPPPPPAPPPPHWEPIHIYQQAPPPQPRIIQQQMPQHPATIIQQMPAQPLVQQLAAPAPLPPLRAGNIKEDMVDLMMMQNAQMHQVVMQNMILKAMPATAPPPVRAAPQDTSAEQSPGIHHHHYGPPQPPLPPIGLPGWPHPGPPYAHGSPFPTGGFPALGGGGGPYGSAPYLPGYPHAAGLVPPLMPLQT